ncbi:MAG: signal peptide peptidase SppA [Pseudanabaenaceae cyanobacterium bins.68]|nr:signal peptide peptidase SppA [Pseudanabaenaceae cyanobacterium bins.68]
MKLNQLIALLLLVTCLVTATLGIQRQVNSEGFALKSLESSTPRLELLTLEGPITGSSRGGGALAIRDRLQEIAQEDQVKGVLLVINSPGGTVAASKELYDAVIRLRQTKPVVVSMLDQATSGGYYVASGATKIYASPGTLTGSIGVILSSINVKTLFDRLGLEAQTYKTGAFKDILSPFRATSEPEKALVQALLQDTYLGFVSDVTKGRKMEFEVVRKLADGRIYTGKQAKDNKLVDALGGYNEALVDLRQLVRKQFNLPSTEPLPIRTFSPSLNQILADLFRADSFASLQGWFGLPVFNLPNETAPPLLLLPNWLS